MDLLTPNFFVAVRTVVRFFMRYRASSRARCSRFSRIEHHSYTRLLLAYVYGAPAGFMHSVCFEAGFDPSSFPCKEKAIRAKRGLLSNCAQSRTSREMCGFVLYLRRETG